MVEQNIHKHAENTKYQIHVAIVHWKAMKWGMDSDPQGPSWRKCTRASVCVNISKWILNRGENAVISEDTSKEETAVQEK